MNGRATCLSPAVRVLGFEVVNDGGGGRVVRASFARKARFRAFRQHFAEFDAPLVVGVYVVKDGLHRHFVLVEGDERAEEAGVSSSRMMVVLGRLPGQVRW